MRKGFMDFFLFVMFTALGLFHWISDATTLAESRATVENLRITLSDPNIGI